MILKRSVSALTTPVPIGFDDSFHESTHGDKEITYGLQGTGN